MTEVLSAESILVNLSNQIEFDWVAGQEDPNLPLHEINASREGEHGPGTP